jgi:hypothetical protein
MAKQSLTDAIREWFAGVVFALYLWSIGMTKDQFWAEQDRQAGNGAGDLFQAADNLLNLKNQIILISTPYSDLKDQIVHAFNVFELVRKNFRQGSASKPSDVGN